jgi:ribosomal protein S18 acetylase RimI-like enzyme
MALSARKLSSADTELFNEFLAPHSAKAFFLRSNARKGGLDFHGQSYQADYFGAFDGERLVGVLAHSWLGNIQTFAETADAWPTLAQCLRDSLAAKPRKVEAFVGMADHIDGLTAALGLSASSFRPGDSDETLFTLDLSRLTEPAALARPELVVRRAEAKDENTILPWRHDYFVEALNAPPGEASMQRAREEWARRLPTGELFVLEDGGKMVSYCGIGGFLTDWTMVGPVWTPPELRGRGYAKAVTAGGLRTLRREGMKSAVLFAVRPDAVRAYEKLGFRAGGNWRLIFLKEPVTAL